MSIQEDDWELDINLGSDATHTIFQRKGVHSFEPDKELVLACERYQYPTESIYFDDDDTNSSIASSSVVSSRYSEFDPALKCLDNFMYDDPPVVETTIPQINQDLPGVVKRLGLPTHYRQAQNHDDWNDDIELPINGVPLNLTKRTADSDQHMMSCSFDDIDDDEIGPSVSQRGSCSRPPLFSYEPQEDEDDMTGIDFPDNMALLSKRLDEKAKQVPDLTANSKRPATRIPTASSLHKPKILAHIPRETDHDDFLDGLHIKGDKPFTISSPASKLPMQRSAPMTTGKTIGTNFVSRLARPTPLNQYKKTAAEQLTTKSTALTTKKTSTPRRFLSGTQASIHREAEIAAKHWANGTAKQPQPKIRNTPSLSKTMDLSAEKKSANGYTLIARPKTKVANGYYCSRLDSIDNLVDLRPKRVYHPKGENKADPVRPWRKNMQTTVDANRSKVKLIQPNEQNLKKEYNNMKYDDITHSWKGNENSLADFQEKPARRSRLMLMTNKQQKPSKYAAVMGGNNMIFDAESQKWVSAFGAQQECNELDEIEDLKDELHQMPSKYNHRKKVEFKLSVETKRQMMYDQERNESWIKHWPLKAEEPEIISPSGHSVGASKYFLFWQTH